MSDEKVLLAHGGGGLLMSELVRDAIVERFSNPHLDAMDDSAVLAPPAGRIAFTTDSFVVTPLFFPGGNIGNLAVCGTVNDLAMSGARALWLSLALIIEEGFGFDDLGRILDAVRRRTREARVSIVCGDTKVVPRGEADGIYMTTSGVGVVPDGVDISSASARPGDAVIVSGALGLHGLAVMLSRGNLSLTSPIESDVAPLGAAVEALHDSGCAVRVLRDLTRGGLAMALTDVAESSDVTIEIDEASIPATDAQQAVCEILGLDVLNIACEGRFLAIVDAASAERAVTLLRDFDSSADAAVVGEVKVKGRYPVELVTPIGSVRVLTPPRGEQMPRIC